MKAERDLMTFVDIVSKEGSACSANPSFDTPSTSFESLISKLYFQVDGVSKEGSAEQADPSFDTTSTNAIRALSAFVLPYKVHK